MDDTIAAIATAVGEAGIGIVRVSGPQALAVADRLFRGTRGRPLASAAAGTVHHGWIMVDGQAVDEVLATVFRAPQSYTREDVVEFSGHGGLVSVRQVLHAVVAAGARLAEPGEFTKRAFLHGRLDLAQAEAVLGLIQAAHEAAQTAMLDQLRGGLSTVLRAARERLLTVRAHLEVSVDFPGEEHAAWSPAEVQTQLAEAARQVERLVGSAARGHAQMGGTVTVICGRPNVGKSSLFNAMLKRDRAIVTPVPGTTRDTIEELVMLQGIPVRLVDTAGLAEPSDAVEAAGMARSHEALQVGDVALWVLDGSEPLTSQDLAVADRLHHQRAIAALNKSDLPQRLAVDQLRAAVPHIPIVPVAARASQGIEALEAALVGLIQRAPAEPGGPLVTSARQADALRRAAAALQRAQAAVVGQRSPELVAADVQEALDQLGVITGETATDDLLDAVFSQFCIGK